MSELQRSFMKSRLPPSGNFSKSGKPDMAKRGRVRDYKPSEWHEFYEEKLDITVDDKNIFRIYKTKPPVKPGPILLLLHGGGYSALTWAHFCVEITNIIHCQCVSIDLRGHGDSITDDDNDLSAETLATDVGKIMKKMYPEECPPILLIGHSMGGAIAVHVGSLDLLPTLVGVTVIDVVEGTAMEALASMQSFLRSRPKYFKSIPNAIEWCVRSGQIRNVDSAKVSMPGQIINCETNKLATNELPLDNDSPESPSVSTFQHPFSISEDAEVDSNTIAETAEFKTPSTEVQNNKKYTWRIDLSKSEVYWKGWFEGLSEKFLNLKVPKLLLLASIDGLDKTLTVGQMQGKFQMQVLARCGHAVHEDRPHEVAEVIGTYLLRNKFAESASEFLRHMPAC